MPQIFEERALQPRKLVLLRRRDLYFESTGILSSTSALASVTSCAASSIEHASDARG